METNGPLQEIIARTLDLVRPVLHAGLSAAEAQWAERVYRDHVLPVRFGHTADPGEETTRRRVASVAKGIVNGLAGLSHEEKLRVLIHLEWMGRLAPLSTKALTLALARAADPENAEPRAEAIAVMASLKEFARELDERHPGDRSLRNELSEALLDADYAAEPSEFLSFRLARLSGLRKERGGREAELMLD